MKLNFYLFGKMRKLHLFIDDANKFIPDNRVDLIFNNAYVFPTKSMTKIDAKYLITPMGETNNMVKKMKPIKSLQIITTSFEKYPREFLESYDKEMTTPKSPLYVTKALILKDACTSIDFQIYKL